MDKLIIQTAQAPAPIGPYSQAVMANGFLFISGQIAIDPQTGVVIQDSIESETLQVMNNIGAVLGKAGMTFSNIIKASIFLADMDQFAKVNEIYGTYFSDSFPARETVEVSCLPKKVNVEISVIACR